MKAGCVRMKIVKVKLKNFRGFYGEKEFNFGGKPFVLLSAQNGLGKTSVIDAIEWCLTGSIGRLKEAYDNRSTNNTERRKNLDGILKNKNAHENDFIEVELIYSHDDKEHRLCRRQKKDDLNSEYSEVYLDGKSDFAKKELERIVDKSFYNYHFCDVQKSFGIQSKQRKDLPELFTEFITDYRKEKAIAENLEIFAIDAERYKDDLEKSKISDLKIKTLKNDIKECRLSTSFMDYPTKKLYIDENCNIENMDKLELDKQLHNLYLCGYYAAEKYLEKIVTNTDTHNLIYKLEELKRILNIKRNEIEKTLKYHLNINNEAIEKIHNKIQKYKCVNLNIRNIREQLKLVLEFDDNKNVNNFFNKLLGEIDVKEKEISDLEKNIKHLTAGNNILMGFSALLAQKENIVKYQEKSKVCPVCGSEKFGDLQSDQILVNAEQYINNNNKLVNEKNIRKVEIEKDVKLLYNNLIQNVSNILKEKVDSLEEQKRRLEYLKDYTKDYFSIINQLSTSNENVCSKESLTTIEHIQGRIDLLNKNLLSKEDVNECRKKYKDILKVIGYNFANEEELTTVMRIREFVKDSPKDVYFDYSLFVQKINAINNTKNNQKYMEKLKELNKCLEQNNEITKTQERYDIVCSKARERSKKIIDLVNELTKLEYESIGPELKKYYKKLARVDSLNTIKIVSEEGQISIIDEQGKNIVNILSNGQLGIFILAYFFSGITKRSEKENCKVYFIDDLTACMDDVNMLSFLDLLKYQLLGGKNIDQLFFSTCDDRICRLLKYKLDGCGIEYCEIGEQDFCSVV